MFIITEMLNAAKIPAGQSEELFRQHVAWFTKHFESGDFILVGPYTDRAMAGIMISPADSRDAAEKILCDDVYYGNGMAEYDVREFKAAMVAENFSAFAGK